MLYLPGVLYLDFRESKLPVVVFVHLFELIVYIALRLTGLLPARMMVFKKGIEFYGSIALGVGLLVGASPWDYRYSGSKRWKFYAYGLLFLLTTGGLLATHFLTLIKVPGSIVTSFFVLTVLEWFGYLGFKGGMIVGCIVVGSALFGLAMFLEHYAKYINFA